MYANLKINIAPKDEDNAVTSEVIYAWSVGVAGDVATVYIDSNDGNSNYSEPAGHRVVDLSTHEITIKPNF